MREHIMPQLCRRLLEVGCRLWVASYHVHLIDDRWILSDHLPGVKDMIEYFPAYTFQEVFMMLPAGCSLVRGELNCGGIAPDITTGGDTPIEALERLLEVFLDSGYTIKDGRLTK